MSMRSTSTIEAETLPATVNEAIEMSVAAGLVYVSDCEPGLRRLQRGKTYRYLKPDDTPVTDKAELQRIASLAIPPAYTDVWICTHPRGHLQATGRDARGRKQYRYHADWRSVRDDAKFGRMIQFGERLPILRRRLRRDLAMRGLPRDKVLAVIVSLLDSTRIRVGNEEYARTNKSFGLTTLRNRHVQFIRDGRAVFKFRGKSGAVHEVAVNDKRLVHIVRSCQELPGQQLFQYLGDDGARHPLDSDQVNHYLKEAMGEDFTAKDFRTWSATLHAIALMASMPLPESPSERALRSCISETVKKVAADLRNTPAVCRKSYINPVVFTAWRCGDLHKAIAAPVSHTAKQAEAVALRFLRVTASGANDSAGRSSSNDSQRSVAGAKRRLLKALQKAEQSSEANGPPAVEETLTSTVPTH